MGVIVWVEIPRNPRLRSGKLFLEWEAGLVGRSQPAGCNRWEEERMWGIACRVARRAGGAIGCRVAAGHPEVAANNFWWN